VGCSTVLLYGQKRDLNAYLSRLPEDAPVRSLADVIGCPIVSKVEYTLQDSPSTPQESANQGISLSTPRPLSVQEANADIARKISWPGREPRTLGGVDRDAS